MKVGRKSKLEIHRLEILGMKREGKTLKDIGDRFNVTAGAIYFFLNPEKNPGRQLKNRPKILAFQKEYIQNLRRKVFTLLGDKCERCGFTDIRALQLDHRNGGGGKEIRKLGHVKMYKEILKDPTNAGEKYQILCANCNWIKRFENDENRK